jgi:LmeA-like phospholipid-binding
METLTIILASFFALISPAGIVLDKVVENLVRSRIYAVERLSVRVDNRPSYAILQGKVDHLRVAARGMQIIENLRLEAVELETDPIDVNPDSLKQGNLLTSLRQPLQGAVRLEIKESDLNQGLASPKIKDMLQRVINKLVPPEAGRQFTLIETKGTFLNNDRLSLTAKIQQSDDPKPLELTLESGFKIIGGHSLQIIEPTGVLNERKLSSRLLKGFADNVSGQLDLRLLEKSGITARVLQFKIEKDNLCLAVFARLSPVKK